MSLRPFLHAWVAFLLLFAQQGAYTHALTHLAAAHQQQDKNLPHSPACDKCVVYAGVGTAAASTPLALEFRNEAVELAPAPLIAFRSESPSHYLSRAPPALA